MIKLYHAPMTRSLRVRWLLEELGVPYTLERVEFAPPAQGFFSQKTPLGKLPVVEDDGVVFCESGAIVEYVVERYGEGRLAPPVGSPERGPFLQWIHFAEGTAFPPLGTIVQNTLYKRNADAAPAVIEDARVRAGSALDFLQRQLGAREFVLPSGFSAADVMLGYTLAIARFLGVLDEHPTLSTYLDRLQARPAFERARAD